jgi:RimJ/RimL family protein N-acetyltransferase
VNFGGCDPGGVNGAGGVRGGVEIRPATVGDFDAWFALYESVAAEGKWIAGELPCDRDERGRSFEATVSADDATALLAWNGDELVGELGLRMQRGIAELGMAIAAGHRGTGIGSALMTEAIGWAVEHGAHKVTLTVWPHNAAARSLYLKHGFVVEGTLRRHHRRRSGELWDAVVMGLVLDHDAPGSPHPSD